VYVKLPSASSGGSESWNVPFPNVYVCVWPLVPVLVNVRVPNIVRPTIDTGALPKYSFEVPVPVPVVVPVLVLVPVDVVVPVELPVLVLVPVEVPVELAPVEVEVPALVPVVVPVLVLVPTLVLVPLPVDVEVPVLETPVEAPVEVPVVVPVVVPDVETGLLFTCPLGTAVPRAKNVPVRSASPSLLKT